MKQPRAQTIQNVCTRVSAFAAIQCERRSGEEQDTHVNAPCTEEGTREKCTKLTGNETLTKTNAAFHKSEKGTFATKRNFYGTLLL